MNNFSPVQGHESPEFREAIDKLWEMSVTDTPLRDGMDWIADKASNDGRSFYEVAYQIVARHQANKRASDWLKNRR